MVRCLRKDFESGLNCSLSSGSSGFGSFSSCVARLPVAASGFLGGRPATVFAGSSFSFSEDQVT